MITLIFQNKSAQVLTCNSFSHSLLWDNICLAIPASQPSPLPTLFIAKTAHIYLLQQKGRCCRHLFPLHIHLLTQRHHCVSRQWCREKDIPLINEPHSPHSPWTNKTGNHISSRLQIPNLWPECQAHVTCPHQFQLLALPGLPTWTPSPKNMYLPFWCLPLWQCWCGRRQENLIFFQEKLSPSHLNQPQYTNDFHLHFMFISSAVRHTLLISKPLRVILQPNRLLPADAPSIHNKELYHAAAPMTAQCPGCLSSAPISANASNASNAKRLQQKAGRTAAASS